jgi:predicted NBD/HSP70 family sugar kinase
MRSSGARSRAGASRSNTARSRADLFPLWRLSEDRAASFVPTLDELRRIREGRPISESLGRSLGALGALRERNSLCVIDALRRHGTASRSDLARLTGLSRTTVGSLVADLQERGFVVEQENGAHAPQGTRGRPPVFLRLDLSVGVAVGIDFDHDRVRVALADLSSTVLAEDCREIDVDRSPAEAIKAALELIHALCRAADVDESQLVGAGVGLPGPINRRTGTLGSSLILPGWAGLPALQELARGLELPVEVDNDANLGALAEASFGAGRGKSDIIYVRLGSGLGAGLVIDGQVHRGAAGVAGEIGHVRVRADGAVCRCGSRGCLETVAAEGAVRELLGSARGHDVTLRDVLDLVATGDRGATGVVNDAGRAIGRVLADLCNALNPEAIVVGGELSEAGEPLLGGIREAIERYALPGAAQALDVMHGELGERAEVLGALALVIGNTENLRSAGLAAVAGTGVVEAVGGRRSRPLRRKEAVLAQST